MIANILPNIIQFDFINKGKPIKVMEDVLLENPIEIELSSNEALYIYHFHTNSPNPYLVNVSSPTASIKYHNYNGINGSHTNIKSHWGNVVFEGKLPEKYFVQAIKVTY